MNKGDGVFDEYEGSLAHIVSRREGLTPAHKLIKTCMDRITETDEHRENEAT